MTFLPRGYGRILRVVNPQTQESVMSAPFTVVFALYPRITQLDFTGQFEVLSRLPNARCVLASVAGGELEADKGLRFTGLARLADIDECSLLCVPGGYGTVNAIEDPEYLRAVMAQRHC